MAHAGCRGFSYYGGINMKIFFASLAMDRFQKYAELFPKNAQNVNVLRSFGIPSPDDWDFYNMPKDMIGSIVVDSGTYTLNNAKKNDIKRITKENYRNYGLAFEKYTDG